MGLFKLAAVVAVGISLLPAEREKQEQLYLRAAAAATWTMTFCDRNPETCSKAGQYWGEFSKKAEFGAKLAYDVLREKSSGAESGSQISSEPNLGPAAPASFETAPRDASGTLTQNDLRPAWRGKTANKAGI